MIDINNFVRFKCIDSKSIFSYLCSSLDKVLWETTFNIQTYNHAYNTVRIICFDSQKSRKTHGILILKAWMMMLNHTLVFKEIYKNIILLK